MTIKLTTSFFLFLSIALVVPGLATTPAQRDQGDSGKTSYTALAQLPVAGSTTNVRIYINRYSSVQDAQALHSILLDGGPKALLKALHKMKSIGKIERESTVGFYDLKFILSKPTGNGRRVFAITDRPLGFLESFYNSRSTDYPFGILELDLQPDEKGREKGTGSLVYAAKIKSLDGDQVQLENFTFAPIKLLGVRQL
ncbi:MAG: hypothetical protein ABI923_12490 [bacterium]